MEQSDLGFHCLPWSSLIGIALFAMEQSDLGLDCLPVHLCCNISGQYSNTHKTNLFLTLLHCIRKNIVRHYQNSNDKASLHIHPSRSWPLLFIKSIIILDHIERPSKAMIRPQGYKTFFMLNSIEHEIFPAHKC